MFSLEIPWLMHNVVFDCVRLIVICCASSKIHVMEKHTIENCVKWGITVEGAYTTAHGKLTKEGL